MSVILYTQLRELPCPLTNDELLAKGDALATTLREVEEEGEAQATARAAMKERMTALVVKQNKLRQEVQEKRELRSINVEVQIADRKKALVQEVRMDTGEIIRTRFADDNERQQLLPMTLPPSVSADAADHGNEKK
jgi:hypothetical protein